MRVVIISRHMTGFGGTETVLAKVAEYYNYKNENSGIKLDLLLPQGVEDSTFLGTFHLYNTAKATRISRSSENRLFRNLRGVIAIISYLEREKPDVVICITSKLILLLYRLRKVLHLNFVIVSWIHFSLDNDVTTKDEQLKLADFHLAISSKIKDQLIERGIQPQSIFLIYNPVSRANLSLEKDKDLKSEITEFVYVGRVQMYKQKNLSELLEAARLLHGAWHITIIGDGADMDILRRQINKFGLIDHFSLPGWQKDPWDKAALYDCEVLTSTYEGFGMVLAEAIAHGIPVISSDSPSGPRDIVTDNNGFLYPMGEFKQLAEMMQLFIDGKVHFSRKTVAESLKKFYGDNYFKRLSKVLLSLNQVRG